MTSSSFKKEFFGKTNDSNDAMQMQYFEIKMRTFQDTLCVQNELQ